MANLGKQWYMQSRTMGKAWGETAQLYRDTRCAILLPYSDCGTVQGTCSILGVSSTKTCCVPLPSVVVASKMFQREEKTYSKRKWYFKLIKINFLHLISFINISSISWL